MITIIKKGIYEILKVFYDSRNSPCHLRELSRKTKLNENSVSRFLDGLVKSKVLDFEKEGNLKKFFVRSQFLPIIFSIYDNERLDNLPLLRRRAILDYLHGIKVKPIFAIVFGSTAKGSFRKDSDIDILLVVNRKMDNKSVMSSIRSQTGLKIQEVQILENDFNKDLTRKKEFVVQSAIESGFSVFNNKYYWEVVNGRKEFR